MELSSIPGYERARARGYRLEEYYREYTYLDLAHSISGIPVGALTLQIYLQLCRADSPFLCGGRVPFIHDVAFFLFRLSPAYTEARTAKIAAAKDIAELRSLATSRLRSIARENGLVRRFSLRRRSALISLLENNAAEVVANAFKRVRANFCARIIHLPFHITVRAIHRFVDRMMLDKPISAKEIDASREPTDISAAADLIHFLASAYGWRRDEILQLPMPEVFQALRKIQRDDPRCPKRALAKVHPLAARFTRRHIALAVDAVEAAIPAATPHVTGSSAAQTMEHHPRFDISTLQPPPPPCCSPPA